MRTRDKVCASQKENEWAVCGSMSGNDLKLFSALPRSANYFANEMIQSTRNIDKISMETRLETREKKELARGIAATGVVCAPFVGKIEFFASCD